MARDFLLEAKMKEAAVAGDRHDVREFLSSAPQSSCLRRLFSGLSRGAPPAGLGRQLLWRFVLRLGFLS